MTENKKTITEAEAQLIWREDDPRFEEVECEPWDDDGKYQNTIKIVRELDTGLMWSLGVTRTGSYYTDYYYQFTPSLVCVEKRERTVVVSEWVPVKP